MFEDLQYERLWEIEMKCPRADYCDVYDRNSKRCKRHYEKCAVWMIEEDRDIREQIERDKINGHLDGLCIMEEE